MILIICISNTVEEIKQQSIDEKNQFNEKKERKRC